MLYVSSNTVLRTIFIGYVNSQDFYHSFVKYAGCKVREFQQDHI